LRALRHLDQSTSAARCIAGLFGFLILIQRFDLPCAMERRRLRRVVRLAMKSAIEGGVSLAMRCLVDWPKSERSKTEPKALGPSA
jgi:hypothetical protein